MNLGIKEPMTGFYVSYPNLLQMDSEPDSAVEFEGSIGDRGRVAQAISRVKESLDGV